MFAIVDDEDFEWVNQLKWCASQNYRGGQYYAKRRTSSNPNRFQYMHREIMNCRENKDVHHCDGTTLDNRKINLAKKSHNHGIFKISEKITK